MELKNGAGVGGSIGDGAIWVSATNTARTSRNNATALNANGNRFGRQASRLAVTTKAVNVPYMNRKRTLKGRT
jgi:hypothetical protein